MTIPEILFTAVVVVAFLGSAVDHWFIGHGTIHRPLRYTILGCFIFTEGYLAVTAQWAMWFYVALNVWGIINLKWGRMIPLPRRKR